MERLWPATVRWWKHAIACVVFIPGIAGALVPSYLHLAAWFRAWMPPGWEDLSYVAALVADAPVFACGVTAILLPSGWRERKPVYALLAFSTIVSIYVNARWAWVHAQAPAGEDWWWTALDVTLGSAVLPLFALAGEVVLDWVLHKLAPGKVPQVARQRERKEPAQAAQGATATTGLAARWRSAIMRHGDDKSLTEIAQLEGVSRQAVSNWRKAATGG